MGKVCLRVLRPWSCGPHLRVIYHWIWKAKAGRRQCKNQERLPSLSVLQPTPQPPRDHRFPLQCLPPSPDQIGSVPPLGGPGYPHHKLGDPVGFQGSCFPNSRHYFTTGTSPDVDIQPAEGRPSRCAPSKPSLTTEDRFTEIRGDFDEWPRRASSRPPHRRSPVRRESPKRALTSAQNQSTDGP